MQIVAFSKPGSWSRNLDLNTAPDLQLIALSPPMDETEVCGGVLRGERNLYAVVGRAGQKLNVRLAAREDNAAFQIYTPGVRIQHRTKPPECVGETLTAETAADLRSWSGTLPATGPYVISVGPTRGNATYALNVSLA